MDRRFDGWSGRVGARGCALLLACIGFALALGAVARSAAGPAPSFAAAKSYATGKRPVSLAIADLNGDSKPDVVTANGTVSVLLNRGDGSFQAKRDYATTGAISVAIGDLNGDGKLDLATANLGANTVSVLLNRGDGTFAAKHDYATGRGPLAAVIGDLNGDGGPDVATANLAFSVSVLLNRGDGSFAAKRDYRTGYPSSLAIGDLNGDGKPELVTANDEADETVSVLLNRGDGSFRAKRDYRTGSGARSVAIGDLNGDGRPDVATANEGGPPAAVPTVSVLANRGDGSFRARHDYRAADIPTSVAIGDLNGDGRPDLVTADAYRTSVSVLLRGNGSFQAKLDYGTRRAESVAIGDLNGDGKPDLATANRASNTVSVLINTPGLCAVQNVEEPGMTLPAAKRTIARVHCRVGEIRRAYSKEVKRGRVISQKPKPGKVLPNGGKVSLVVSRGRRPS
jgi:predicted NUDIX family NTP pyrophosphohydrolase